MALMIMLGVMTLGFTTLLVRSLNTTDIGNERQARTSAALAQAKDALIGKSVIYDDYPGSLPCPDLVTDIPNNRSNDGIADLLAGNDCPSYIGRLPWKTLGLPDLRDASGERLWYALSRNMRRDDSVRPLNSNTKGTIEVYHADGTTLLTQAGYSAVAVIFSPGSPFGSQTRTTAAEKNNAANYLDSVNGRNNASASGPYIAGSKSDSFNDQLLFITTRNLMPLIEQRVAGEVKRALANYYTYSGCLCYPWADSVDQFADYDSNEGLNRGWLPNHASPVDWTSSYAPPSIKPPQWFFDNQWYKLIYYSVARNYKDPEHNCYSCDHSTLHVDSNFGVRALFFMPGTFAGIRRPDNLSDYLENPENKDDNDDDYITPTSQAGDRDRLYLLQ